MTTPTSPTQLVFHYLNGQMETFQVPGFGECSSEQEQGLNLQMQDFLQQDWWVLHLPEQTVYIHVSHVIKIEIKPALPPYDGEGVLPVAQRVTALSRTR